MVPPVTSLIIAAGLLLIALVRIVLYWRTPSSRYMTIAAACLACAMGLQPGDNPVLIDDLARSVTSLANASELIADLLFISMSACLMLHVSVSFDRHDLVGPLYAIAAIVGGSLVALYASSGARSEQLLTLRLVTDDVALKLYFALFGSMAVAAGLFFVYACVVTPSAGVAQRAILTVYALTGAAVGLIGQQSITVGFVYHINPPPPVFLNMAWSLVLLLGLCLLVGLTLTIIANLSGVDLRRRLIRPH